jgi:hypothetical protein
MCPSCGQNAPLVYRGVSAFCSACGKPRMPFTANAVNLRGKPAKLGGTVASVVGWVVLFGTLAAALIVGALFQALFPAAVLGWVLGGLIGTIGVAVSLLLLFGGRALRRSGTDAAQAARLDALGTLAAYQRGIVTSQAASEALGVSFEEADAFLTALAKQPESGVSLEVDDEGKLTYRFLRYAPQPVWPPEAKVRVKTELGEPPAQAAGAPQSPQRQAGAAKGGTEAMPQVLPHGPGGTKVVAAHPPGTPPPAEVRIAEPEGVPLEDEISADPRRMRS